MQSKFFELWEIATGVHPNFVCNMEYTKTGWVLTISADKCLEPFFTKEHEISEYLFAYAYIALFDYLDENYKR